MNGTAEVVDRKEKAIVGLVVLLAFPLLLWWWGFVGARLWLWFIVPFGLPTLSAWQAAAIGMTLKFFASINHDDIAAREIRQRKDWTNDASHVIASLVLRPAMLLLVGWILKGVTP